MSENTKARGATNAGALEVVHFEKQNTSTITKNLPISQPLTGYSFDKQLLVVTVYRHKVRHA